MNQTLILVSVWIAMLGSYAMGADEYEQPPIEYSASTPDNCISQLQSAIDRNEETLKRDAKQGYLRDLLEKLKISPDVANSCLLEDQQAARSHCASDAAGDLLQRRRLCRLLSQRR